MGHLLLQWHENSYDLPVPKQQLCIISYFLRVVIIDPPTPPASPAVHQSPPSPRGFVNIGGDTVKFNKKRSKMINSAAEDGGEAMKNRKTGFQRALLVAEVVKEAWPFTLPHLGECHVQESE